jgi:hypothetical protein
MLRDTIRETLRTQEGLLFATPAIVCRPSYSGRAWSMIEDTFPWSGG